MSPLRLACLALALCCCCALMASPAAAQGNITFVKYEALVKALTAQPFDPKLRDTLVDNMVQAMSMYAFADLSKNSSDGAPAGTRITELNYNVYAALATVKQTVYPNDFAMNSALSQVFRPLNDAHTRYHKDQYSGLAFSLPTKMYGIGNSDGTQALFLSGTERGFSVYEKVYGYSPLANLTLLANTTVRPTNIENFIVSQIDGVDAVQYLWSLATLQNPADSFATGWSKDAHSRFNLLVHGFGADESGPPGWFLYRPLWQFDYPRNELVHFHLRDPSFPQRVYGLTMRWMGLVPKSLDAEVFPLPPRKNDRIVNEQNVAKYWWSIHSLQHPMLWAERAHYLNSGEVGPPATVPVPATTLSATDSLQQSIDRALAAGELLKFGIPGVINFEILEDNTAALQIFNFEPDVTQDFMNVVVAAVSAHQQRLNGTKIIIDLRSNGGGDICLGYAILRFLFPQISRPNYGFDAADRPFGRYDTVVAPLTQVLADLGAQNLIDFPAANPCDLFTPCAWDDPDTQLPYASEKWFDSGRMLNRGGVTRQYSALFHDSCLDYEAQMPPAAINRGYDPSNVVLVSDGMCGSTCSVFSSYIHFHRLAKTVVLGGLNALPPLPAQFWSFPGGQVMDVGDLQSIATDYGLLANDSRVPQPPANGASQSFAFREIYAWTDTEGVYPLEFLSVPAALHLPYAVSWLVGSRPLWESLISVYDVFGPNTCAAGVTSNPCPVANGQGERQCENGKIVPLLCAITSCDAGYFMDAAKAMCSPCAAGFYRGATDSFCVACPVVPVNTVGDIPCTQQYTGVAVTSSACPLTVTCTNSAGTPTSDDSGVSKSAVIAVGVVLGLIALILIVAIVRMKMTGSKRQNTLDDPLMMHS